MKLSIVSLIFVCLVFSCSDKDVHTEILSTENLKSTWMSVEHINLLYKTNSISKTLKRIKNWSEFRFVRDSIFEFHMGGGLPIEISINPINFEIKSSYNSYNYRLLKIHNDTLFIQSIDSLIWKFIRVENNEGSDDFPNAWINVRNKWFSGKYKINYEDKVELVELTHDNKVIGSDRFNSWSLFTYQGDDVLQFYSDIYYEGDEMKRDLYRFIISGYRKNTFNLMEEELLEGSLLLYEYKGKKATLKRQ